MKALLFILILLGVIVGGATVVSLYQPQHRAFVAGMWLAASILGTVIFYYFFRGAIPGRNVPSADEGGD